MSPAEEPISEKPVEHGQTILVVEDEVLIRLSDAEHLRDDGFVVIEAASAQEARSVLMAGVDVDLVFSDINMPGDIDGVGLAQWIALHDSEIPVVLTSGVPSALALANAACALVKDFVAKPYDHDALSARVKELLARQERLR